jgi:monofunctional glycosyltransferase
MQQGVEQCTCFIGAAKQGFFKGQVQYPVLSALCSDMTLETQPIAADEPERKVAASGWRTLLYIAIFVAAWPIVMTLVYAIVPPPISNVMVLRFLSGNGLSKDWVSLEEMSPRIASAVITSEDARFCAHHGVDWVQVQWAVEEAFDGEEGRTSGASTIAMQTAKNLFLWDGRSFIRKGLEIPVALWMDFVWTKRRMIEVYLNIAEWAPGVYGAEAAARHHFNKPASRLTRREAALLAAALPNPIKRKAGKPSKRVSAIANRILIRMNAMGGHLACLAE